jgi:hypothetical protein
MRILRILFGLACWGAALGLLAAWMLGTTDASAAARRHWWSSVKEYSVGSRQSLELRLPAPQVVAVGDPIFIAHGDGRLEQVGEVSLLLDRGRRLPSRQARVARAEAILYPSAAHLRADLEVEYVSTPDSLAWVVETLLPPERKAQVAAEMSAALEAHRDEILAALRPIAEKSLRESLTVVEQDLPAAIARQRPELEAIGSRYHREILEKELVPLVQDEIWPIVRRRGEPTVNEVGKEIWKHVSLWRFGWRYAVDRLPLTEDRRVQEEWQRFLNEEAMPILQAHTDDFLQVIEDILRDTSKDPEVREAFRRNMKYVVEDPQLQRVVWKIFREAIVDNPRLRETLKRNWTSPEAQAAFHLASERFEPHVRRMGDTIFGTPERGITPEFAQVLRNQILHKDRRWFLLSVREEGQDRRRGLATVAR